MTPEIFFSRIEVIASALFLIWFVYSRWQQLVIDVTRHELFKIRHKIFLLAADGELDFKSAEYKELRDTFNGLIRYCHTITFPRVVAVYIAKPYQKPHHFRIADVLGRFKDEQIRRELEVEWRRAADFVSLATFLRSPVLMLIAVLLAPLLPLFSVLVILDRQTYKNRYRIVRSTVERGIEMEASRDLQPRLIAA